MTLAVAATGHAYGGLVLTRCAVVGARRSQRDHRITVLLHDLESDAARQASARVVVNASGVWTDAVRAQLGIDGRRLRPSRGIHLILPPHLLRLEAAVSFPSPDDGRPVFMVPHPEGILLGTTDIYHDGDLDDPRPTTREVDYLLAATRAAFPAIQVTPGHLRGAYAGLRPILDSHADDPSEASRDEDLWVEDGVLSVAGGKLTTWRSTAEDVVDRSLELLPEDRTRHIAPCATKGTPLIGLAPADLGRRLVLTGEIQSEVAAAMARRLGSLAWQALSGARRRSELDPLEPGCDLCAAEVRTHLRFGAVLHLDDLLLRRTRVGMWYPELALQLVRRVRPLLRSGLGWDWKRWRWEERSFAASLEGWTLAGVTGKRKAESGTA
jgi:glycerol-3-phosphate dehydrogenase